MWSTPKTAATSTRLGKNDLTSGVTTWKASWIWQLAIACPLLELYQTLNCALNIGLRVRFPAQLLKFILVQDELTTVGIHKEIKCQINVVKLAGMESGRPAECCSTSLSVRRHQKRSGRC